LKKETTKASGKGENFESGRKAKKGEGGARGLIQGREEGVILIVIEKSIG